LAAVITSGNNTMLLDQLGALVKKSFVFENFMLTLLRLINYY